MVKFGPSVFYLFGPSIINSVLGFSIYLALPIGFTILAHCGVGSQKILSMSKSTTHAVGTREGETQPKSHLWNRLILNLWELTGLGKKISVTTLYDVSPIGLLFHVSVLVTIFGLGDVILSEVGPLGRIWKAE